MTKIPEPHLDVKTFLSLPQAAKLVPTSSGRHPGTATLWRWCTKGFSTPSGETVKLVHVRFGSRICVTVAALQEFAERCASAWNATTPTAPAAPAPRRKRRVPTSNADPKRAKQIAAARQEMAALCSEKGGCRQ